MKALERYLKVITEYELDLAYWNEGNNKDRIPVWEQCIECFSIFLEVFYFYYFACAKIICQEYIGPSVFPTDCFPVFWEARVLLIVSTEQ